jgi:hypothetical protein
LSNEGVLSGSIASRPATANVLDAMASWVRHRNPGDAAGLSNSAHSEITSM